MKAIHYILIIFLMMAKVSPAFAVIELKINDNTGYVGDTVQVEISSQTNLTDSNVVAYQLELSYSTTYLQPISATSSGTLSEAWGEPQYNDSITSKVRLSAAGSSALSGNGTLVKVSFRLLRQGNISVSFANSAYNMLNEGNPELSLTNGHINIQTRPYITVTPNQGRIAIGETLQFYSSHGTAPYTYSVSDANIASINSSGLLTGLKRGFVYVISVDQNSVIDSTDQMIEVVPYKLTIRDTTYYQNQWVEIPVNISLLDVEAVNSGQLMVSFNSAILMADSVITDGTILSGADVVEPNLSTPGQVSLSFANHTSLTGKGVLFYIRFRIANQTSGSTTLTLGNALFNENLGAIYDNGYFTIKALPPLNVTPKNALLFVGDQQTFQVSGGTEPYSWSVSDTSMAHITQDGLLTAKSGGDITVTANDYFGATGSSNTISIFDGKLTVGKVQAPINADSVLVPVSITSLSPAKGLVSFSGETTINPDKIGSVNLYQIGSLTDGWANASNTENGLFKFALAGTQATLGNDTLLQLKMTYGTSVQVGNVIPVQLSNAIANEGSPRLQVNQGSITVNIADHTQNQTSELFQVYPVPSNGRIYFTCSSPVYGVRVTDLTGKMTLSYHYPQGVSSGMVDMSQQANGVYVLRLKTGQGDLISKIIIQ